uniref:DUF3307 domain-containing protein n=1 Tax=Dictyoglomus thermophilum TaxID=14 RepID=A0A7C3RL81_DICTH
MFWFLRLFLAHLIADFTLQTNRVFKYKVYNKYGVLIHTSIYLVITILLSIPYLTSPMCFSYIFILFSLHTIIDLSKIKKISKSNGIREFLKDQIQHFITLISVFLLPQAKEPKYLNLSSPLSFLNRFYNSDYYILLSIGYFFVAFAGTIFYFYVIKTFGGKNIFYKDGISIKEKYMEVILRTIIFITYYIGSFYVSLFVFIILRILEMIINKTYRNIISFLLILTYDFTFIFSMITFLNALLGT